MNASKILFLCVLFASGLWAAEAPEIAELRAKAEAGDVMAQTRLGVRYELGQGVPHSFGDARRWYERAAESGGVEAQSNLGEIYDEGDGVERDAIAAAHWFGRAAAAGNKIAERRLKQLQHEFAFFRKTDRATTPDLPEGVSIDKVRAAIDSALADARNKRESVRAESLEKIDVLREEAAKGDADAENRLGVRFYRGTGTKADDAKAVELFKSAASKGDIFALGNLGAIHSDELIEKDQFRWLTAAAAAGNPAAQANLAWKYRDARGVEEDNAEALKWFKLSARGGSIAAAEVLGSWYWSGSNGVEEDLRAATDYYEMAASAEISDDYERRIAYHYSESHRIEAMERLELIYGYAKQPDYQRAYGIRLALAGEGDPSAMESLGWHYEFGRGVPRDLEKSASWYLKAAGQKKVSAMFTVAGFYERGAGVAQDFDAAQRWLKKATKGSDAGDRVHALLELGRHCSLGLGCPVDHISATEYYRTAAEMGSQTAQEILAYQYLEGRGVLRSPVMAHAWLNVASARSRGGEQKKFLDEIEKGLTRDQLAEASRIASDLFERFKPSKEVERWEMLRELQRGESSRTK